jgi:hypothetical protein
VYHAFEAVIDETGNVRLNETLQFAAPRRALVIVMESDEPAIDETALLSEDALAVDWNRPEEDAAWAHLQPGKS